MRARDSRLIRRSPLEGTHPDGVTRCGWRVWTTCAPELSSSSPPLAGASVPGARNRSVLVQRRERYLHVNPQQLPRRGASRGSADLRLVDAVHVAASALS